MPATRYPDDFLIRILGQTAFNTALGAATPLYDPGAGRQDYFSLSPISANSITLKGGESKFGARLELSAALRWLTATYIFTFERNNDPKIAYGYTLVQSTKQTPSLNERLRAGTDFTQSPLLTDKAMEFLRHMVLDIFGSRTAMPSSAQTDFLKALDFARTKKTLPLNASENPEDRCPDISRIFLNAHLSDDRIREILFLSAGKCPPPLLDGGYAAGPLYETSDRKWAPTPNHP